MLCCFIAYNYMHQNILRLEFCVIDDNNNNDNLCLTISDAALTAVGDPVCLKWQKYLQFKSEIYYAYVSLTP